MSQIYPNYKCNIKNYLFRKMAKQIFAEEYEKYLLTGKEEVLNSLSNNSIEKEYFFLIRKLLNQELTPDLEKDIQTFIDKVPKEQLYRLKALYIFQKIKQHPERKSEIIQDIKDLFHFDEIKNYVKPLKYNKNISNENEDKKISNKLNLDNY